MITGYRLSLEEIQLIKRPDALVAGQHFPVKIHLRVHCGLEPVALNSFLFADGRMLDDIFAQQNQ